MRICAQSNTDFTVAERWSAYLAAETAHLRAVARSDTEVELAGVRSMATGVTRSAVSRFANTQQLIESCLDARSRGFDAVAVIGLATMGKDELLEAMPVPIVFAQDVAWTFAAWQYRRFGLLSHDPRVYFRRVDQIHASGLDDCFVPGDYGRLSVDDLLAGFDDLEPLLPVLEASAHRAANDGARVLIPDVNPLNTLLVASGVTSLCGVPVLDTSGITLKATELLLDARAAGILDRLAEFRTDGTT